MTMQIGANYSNISQIDAKNTISQNSATIGIKKEPQFKNLQNVSNAPLHLKTGVFLTTLAGLGTAFALTLKGMGKPYSLSKIFKTNPKNWAIFHVKYDEKKNEVVKLVSALALGSIAGGLAGGALFDKKENMESKYRETIIQVGNVFTPLLCLAGGMKLLDKFKPQISKLIPKFKGESKAKLNETIQKVPEVLVSGLSLIAGIFLGNKIGNNLNRTIFNVDDKRKIKLSDMSPHIDDVCLATSLIATKSPIGAQVSRFIPLAMLVPGFSVGTAQEKSEKLANNVAEQASKSIAPTDEQAKQVEPAKV